MKTIVVPTDFSDCALSALKVASTIARKIEASIDVVHTYELPIYGFSSGQVMYDGFEIGKIKEELNKQLDKMMENEFLSGLQVKKHLIVGNDIDEFMDLDDLDDIRLVVMGTHGASGWKEDFIGSNAEKIIRKSEFPVLVVRENDGENFNPKRIVFASNFFGEVYDRFQKFKDFAEVFDAEIIFVRINTASNFESTMYSELLMNDFKKKFEMPDAQIHVYNDYSVEEGVLNFAKRIEADMIAMETHGRKGLNHFVNGSVAEEVANHTEVPLLTFKIKAPQKPRGVIFPEIH